MSRFIVTINGNTDRERAARWCMATKAGMRVEFKEAKRSGDQNDRMWAMLGEVAAQVPWHGIKLSPDDWKFIFLDALKRELRVVPNIDGTGFVNLGRSSSDLSKDEMSDLMELIAAFGAQHDVKFRDEDSASAERSDLNPQSDQPEAPAASPTPQPQATAGDNTEIVSEAAPPPDEGAGAGGSSTESAGPALPEGWAIVYASALRRAQKKESLEKYAAQFWAQHGGWASIVGADRETGAAIFNTFSQNFGNKDAIDRELREII